MFSDERMCRMSETGQLCQLLSEDRHLTFTIIPRAVSVKRTITRVAMIVALKREEFLLRIEGYFSCYGYFYAFFSTFVCSLTRRVEFLTLLNVGGKHRHTQKSSIE